MPKLTLPEKALEEADGLRMYTTEIAPIFFCTVSLTEPDGSIEVVKVWEAA